MPLITDRFTAWTLNYIEPALQNILYAYTCEETIDISLVCLVTHLIFFSLKLPCTFVVDYSNLKYILFNNMNWTVGLDEFFLAQ